MSSTKASYTKHEAKFFNHLASSCMKSERNFNHIVICWVQNQGLTTWITIRWKHSARKRAARKCSAIVSKRTVKIITWQADGKCHVALNASQLHETTRQHKSHCHMSTTKPISYTNHDAVFCCKISVSGKTQYDVAKSESHSNRHVVSQAENHSF